MFKVESICTGKSKLLVDGIWIWNLEVIGLSIVEESSLGLPISLMENLIKTFPKFLTL